jgi:hypothetical protein
MRFESLEQDFGEVLRQLGLAQVRALPLRNKTRRDSISAFEHFTGKMRKKACWVFGPFMADWGYSFPENWGFTKPRLDAKVLYSLLGFVRTLYWHGK